MIENNLTKDSYKVLVQIYKVYLQRQKDGISKGDAKMFSDYGSFRKDYIPEYDANDFYECIIELKQNEFIKLYVDGGFMLSSNGIVLLENRFKNGLSEVMDVISKFI